MSIKKKILLFWKTFLREQKDLEKALDNQEVNEIRRIRGELNDLMIQTCGCYLNLSKEDEFYECTFLPEEDKTSQLLCVFLKQFAPSIVNETWRVNDCRPPMSEQVYHMTFDVRDVSYTISDMVVSIQAQKELNAFDLHIVCDAFQWMSEPEAEATIQRILKYVLGDVLFENNLNEVSFAPTPKKDLHYDPLCDLYEIICDKMDELEMTFYTNNTQTYRIFRRNEAETSDEFLQDRLLISTLHPYLFVETMEKQRVILDQCTRLGGEFGVMAYEIEKYDESEANKKHQLEVSINELMMSHATARIIGSAIGKKHIYFDVLILDKEDFKTTLVTLAKNGFVFTYRPY